MKNKLIFPLIFVGFGVACGGDDGARRGSQQSYEVVQEGSASGVTSTIQGPGETLPPLTGTNADTTTSFSIDPNAVAGAPQQTPGTLAGAMPPSYPPAMSSPTTRPPVNYTPPAQQAAPVTRMPSSEPRTYPQPQQQRPVPQERPPAQQPPATDTAVTPQPAQPAPQPQPEPEQEEEEEEEEPPPPTTTDTRGQ